jgi:hypothetical protein
MFAAKTMEKTTMENEEEKKNNKHRRTNNSFFEWGVFIQWQNQAKTLDYV